MKRVLFILLLVQAIAVNAQNWAPISRTEKFNFTDSAGQLVTKTLWIDSVSFNGTDSIFYFNRVVQYCDSCGYALLHQPQFLQKQVTVSANGSWNFTQPGKLVLNTLATLNDTAFVDLVNNVTGIVTAVNITIIFGVTDSVKTIALSSSDTILLSQNYGLQQFPKSYGSNAYNILTGIQEGRNLGVQVPMLKDIYDFQVGDVFLYYDYAARAYPSSEESRWTKDSIISKSVTGNIISYNRHYYTVDTFLGFMFTSSQGYDALTLVDTANDILNSYPNQQLYVFSYSTGINTYENPVFYYNCPDFANNFVNVSIYTDSSGKIIRQLGSNVFGCNNCTDTIPLIFSDWSFTSFQKNLGVVNAISSYCPAGYESFQLVGAQTVTDTFGSVFLGVNEKEIENTKIVITNPVSEIISVNIKNMPATFSTNIQL